jgi:two-component system CheB/CheR fusion protein
MRRQTDSLNRANGYLSGILSGLGAGVIVLNQNLEVELWNAVSEEQWGLRAKEVERTHFLSLDIGLPVEELVPAMRRCLAREAEETRTVVRARNRRGRPVEARVTCRRLPPIPGASSSLILMIDLHEVAEDGQES